MTFSSFNAWVLGEFEIRPVHTKGMSNKEGRNVREMAGTKRINAREMQRDAIEERMRTIQAALITSS